MAKKLPIKNSTAEFLIFKTQSGKDTIDVRIENENVWLTQKLTAKLIGVEVNTINYHLKEIFNSGELNEESTVRKFRIVQNKMHFATHGKTAAELIINRANHKKNHLNLILTGN